MKRLIGLTMLALLTVAGSGCCSSGCSLFRSEPKYEAAPCGCAPAYGATRMYGGCNTCGSVTSSYGGCDTCGSSCGTGSCGGSGGSCGTSGTYYGEPAMVP